jgi:hypothetical protein
MTQLTAVLTHLAGTAVRIFVINLRTRWAGTVECMLRNTNAYIVLVGKRDKRPLGNRRKREAVWEGIDFICLA